jgi:hypothetical protein
MCNATIPIFLSPLVMADNATNPCTLDDAILNMWIETVVDPNSTQTGSVAATTCAGFHDFMGCYFSDKRSARTLTALVDDDDSITVQGIEDFVRISNRPLFDKLGGFRNRSHALSEGEGGCDPATRQQGVTVSSVRVAAWSFKSSVDKGRQIVKADSRVQAEIEKKRAAETLNNMPPDKRFASSKHRCHFYNTCKD